MDGFQAVQSIKNNPRTATIPIMMFTSQEGELYLGQARALGALGVLPKQVKPTEVSTVLHQLRLVPDRRRARVTSFEPGNAVAHEAFRRPAAAAVSIIGVSTGTDGPPESPSATPFSGETGLTPVQLRALLDGIVREQLAEQRRSLSSLFDEQTERLMGQVREVLASQPPASVTDVAGEALFAAHEPPTPAPRAPWLIAALFSVVAAALAVLWWQEMQQSQRLAAQLLESRAALTGRAGGAASWAAVRAPAPALPAPWNGAASAATTPASDAAAPAALPAVAASETVQLVPYGELPMAGDRLESVRRMLEDLAIRGFRGVVTVTAFPGRYCLTRSPTDGFEVAVAEAPLSKCDVLGNPFDEQLGPAQREPLSLANLVGAIRQRSGGAIDVQLVTGAETQRVAAYPEQVSGRAATAGDWNRAAASNNRVEIRVQPTIT